MNCLMKCINKNDGKTRSNFFLRYLFDHCLYRQKDMQRQLNKITELVQLVVHKMEISTEIVIDDRSKADNKKKCIETPQLQQALNVARRLHRLRPSTNKSISNTVGHINV